MNPHYTGRSVSFGDRLGDRVGRFLPAFGALAATLRRIDVDRQRAVGQAIERVGSHPANELRVLSLRGDVSAHEVVVSGEDLEHDEAVGVGRLPDGVTEQLGRVVRWAGPTPLQFDDESVRPTATDVDRRGLGGYSVSQSIAGRASANRSARCVPTSVANAPTNAVSDSDNVCVSGLTQYLGG